jgi:hypothetical protein
MKHATSRMLYAYWNDLRGDRAAPERGEIEPGAIRHILADTFVLELDAAGAARIRLAGTRCCALFGRELKGSRFDSLWPKREASDIAGLVATVLDETAAVVAGLRAAAGERGLDLELLLLPLRYRGKTHARMLGSLSLAVIPDWLGLAPVEDLAISSLRVIRPARRQPGGPPDVLSAAERRQRFVVHPGGRA